MSDRFDEWLEENSKTLKYEPANPFVWSRIQARVQERVRRPLTMFDVLFRWRRAVAVTLAMLGVVSALSIWELSETYMPPLLDSVMTADLASEDFYRVVP
jgi:hypothetical protein